MPLGSSSRVWKALAAFPDPHSSLLFSLPTSLSLLPPAKRCIGVGGGVSVAMAGAMGGTEETLSFVLPYSPVHEAFLLPASSAGPSHFSYDPPPLCPFHSGDPCFFNVPTFPPLLSSFPSCPCLRSYSPCPSYMTCLWLGRGGGSRSRGLGILYIMYIFSCVRERSPCVLSAAHSLCVCVASSCPGWE